MTPIFIPNNSALAITRLGFCSHLSLSPLSRLQLGEMCEDSRMNLATVVLIPRYVFSWELDSIFSPQLEALDTSWSILRAVVPSLPIQIDHSGFKLITPGERPYTLIIVDLDDDAKVESALYPILSYITSEEAGSSVIPRSRLVLVEASDFDAINVHSIVGSSRIGDDQNTRLDDLFLASIALTRAESRTYSFDEIEAAIFWTVREQVGSGNLHGSKGWRVIHNTIRCDQLDIFREMNLNSIRHEDVEASMARVSSNTLRLITRFQSKAVEHSSANGGYVLESAPLHHTLRDNDVIDIEVMRLFASSV